MHDRSPARGDAPRHDPSDLLVERRSGVLLHVTSLPGPQGCGDLGPAAYEFVDFLARARQRIWQILPVGPTGAGNSPYGSTSVFAGNPLLVSLELLAGEGLLADEDVVAPAPDMATVSPGEGAEARADFGWAIEWRMPRLKRAFEAFQARGEPPSARAPRVGETESEPESFFDFVQKHVSWLEDFALFSALKEAHGGASWLDWEEPLRQRQPAALSDAKKRLAREVQFHRFVQWQFDRQWRRLRRHAHANGVALFGDIPIFVALDSADVWTNPHLFQLDEARAPTHVAGVPPDYFSEDGQLWGNPLYAWERHASDGYAWWIARLRATFDRYDIVRLDHFIGFVRYWRIPFGEKTAKNGAWVPGPGSGLFKRVREVLGPLPLVAEDLGVVTPEIVATRDENGLPGMYVLHFGFSPGAGAEPARPHNAPRNTVIYTGTHDNDTTMGWLTTRPADADDAEIAAWEAERRFALRYVASDGAAFSWDLLRLAWMSHARTAIVPAQDLLGLGSEARMNVPGVAAGNWGYRLAPGGLDDSIAKRLADLTELYGRATALEAS